ncbi:MAG: ribonuclease III [Leptospiraceae bacterium]|nr:ribonuclease III [Leptospiraceae bacterium]
MTEDRKSSLQLLQRKTGVFFKDIKLLDLAFTHKSYSNENAKQDHNERLELLGDSVLSILTVEWLYKNYPKHSEGKLSSMKAKLVSESVLFQIAKNESLGEFLLLGRGEKATGGSDRKSLLANLVEAFLASIYIDSGLDHARNWIIPKIKLFAIKSSVENSFKDYKTKLQEYSQKKWKLVPSYKLISEIGLDHEKLFTVEVSINNEKKAIGEGKSKRLAEQEAAEKLFLQLSKKQ